MRAALTSSFLLLPISQLTSGIYAATPEDVGIPTYHGFRVSVDGAFTGNCIQEDSPFGSCEQKYQGCNANDAYTAAQCNNYFTACATCIRNTTGIYYNAGSPLSSGVLVQDQADCTTLFSDCATKIPIPQAGVCDTRVGAAEFFVTCENRYAPAGVPCEGNRKLYEDCVTEQQSCRAQCPLFDRNCCTQCNTKGFEPAVAPCEAAGKSCYVPATEEAERWSTCNLWAQVQYGQRTQICRQAHGLGLTSDRCYPGSNQPCYGCDAVDCSTMHCKPDCAFQWDTCTAPALALFQSDLARCNCLYDSTCHPDYESVLGECCTGISDATCIAPPPVMGLNSTETILSICQECTDQALYAYDECLVGKTAGDQIVCNDAMILAVAICECSCDTAWNISCNDCAAAQLNSCVAYLNSTGTSTPPSNNDPASYIDILAFFNRRKTKRPNFFGLATTKASPACSTSQLDTLFHSWDINPCGLVCNQIDSVAREQCLRTGCNVMSDTAFYDYDCAKTASAPNNYAHILGDCDTVVEACITTNCAGKADGRWYECNRPLNPDFIEISNTYPSCNTDLVTEQNICRCQSLLATAGGCYPSCTSAELSQCSQELASTSWYEKVVNFKNYTATSLHAGPYPALNTTNALPRCMEHSTGACLATAQDAHDKCVTDCASDTTGGCTSLCESNKEADTRTCECVQLDTSVTYSTVLDCQPVIDKCRADVTDAIAAEIKRGAEAYVDAVNHCNFKNECCNGFLDQENCSGTGDRALSKAGLGTAAFKFILAIKSGFDIERKITDAFLPAGLAIYTKIESFLATALTDAFGAAIFDFEFTLRKRDTLSLEKRAENCSGAIFRC